MRFDELMEKATGFPPYDYQARIAAEGLPELLRIPTGAGKTATAVLPWLWRRRYHLESDVRATTPRWLVVVLPQRGLVEQTHTFVARWRDALGLRGEVGLHVLMGGVHREDRAWQLHPGADAVFVGTQDMVLSRILMRGYGSGRRIWPVEAGLLSSGVQFVFDETQLMGPGLQTSLQMQGLREALGTAAATHSMWMSATVDAGRLTTVDKPAPRSVVELSDADRSGPLRARLTATRTVRELVVPEESRAYADEVAARLLDAHFPGTRTIAVINTVDRARSVFDAVRRRGTDADLVLLHSRFRPDDRRRHLSAALAEPKGSGTVVVSTQVLEAGVDVTSTVLFTEVAPWSSVVQRAGRCNRAGESPDARILWAVPPQGKGRWSPYEESDCEAAVAGLRVREGSGVTTTELQESPVEEAVPLHQVIRRRDVLDLFDTAPDLMGNDIDIGRWVRDPDQSTVFVAWRTWEGEKPDEDQRPMRPAELCPVPISDVAKLVKSDGNRPFWLFDQVEGTWRRLGPDGVRPGVVLLRQAVAGGYTPEGGWLSSSREAVEPVPPAGDVDTDPAGKEAALESDALSAGGSWVALPQHLADTAEEARAIVGDFMSLTLSPELRSAIVTAASLHDTGKVHSVFQDTMRRAVGTGGPAGAPGPWAKAPGRARHARRYFSHELAGGLALMHPECHVLDGDPERDLVTFLVMAHHGRVRATVRAHPGEPRGTVLGVIDGDVLPALTLPTGMTPDLVLNLGPVRLGGGTTGRSWAEVVRGLRDRPDLGPFRLTFMEALVRMADWRASARYDAPVAASGPLATSVSP